MKIEYYLKTDTLLLELKASEINETRALDDASLPTCMPLVASAHLL